MGYNIISSETNDPQQRSTHLRPLNPQHDDPHNIIRSSQPIVHLLPIRPQPQHQNYSKLFLNIFHFSFTTKVLPEVVGVLVPGVW